MFNPEKYLPRENKQRGIVFALIAMFLFSFMAALSKYLAARYSVYEIAFFRFLFALVPILPLIVMQGGWQVFETKRFTGHLWRSFFGFGSLILYFYSIRSLPLADAVAVSFTNPLFITLLSILVLKEKVGVVTWVALALGFTGVLLIAEPKDLHLNIGVFFGLGSALFYAFAMTSLRALGATEKMVTTTSYFTLLATCYAAIPTYFTWVAPSFFDLMLFMSCGLVAGIGQLFLTRAYQLAPPSVVSPFNYTSILWAVILGFLVWGHIPEIHVWIGAMVVIASGFLIVCRESDSRSQGSEERS